MQMYDIILESLGSLALSGKLDADAFLWPSTLAEEQHTFSHEALASMEYPWDENPRFSSEAEWSKISTEFTNVRYF